MFTPYLCGDRYHPLTVRDGISFDCYVFFVLQLVVCPTPNCSVNSDVERGENRGDEGMGAQGQEVDALGAGIGACRNGGLVGIDMIYPHRVY